jgi:predicted Zn-dependent protease
MSASYDIAGKDSERKRGERMLNATARKWLVVTGAVLAAAAFAPQDIWAAGDPPAEPAKEKPKSKPKPKQKPKQKDSLLNQDQVYSLGYWQAKNGDYDAALATLRSAAKQDDPRVQTMIGFTLRKLGRVDEAFGHYFKALATRPDSTTTRQYLGEAYLQIGDPARAREQLAEIAKRCGTTCEDYVALSQEIAKHERRT